MQMVVQRELRASARRRGSYWARVLAGAFAALALLQSTGNVANGRRLFFTAVILAFIACVFEGVRRAAESIATEKNEGTLGLLFLTPLSGPELLRGKFAAIAISAFQMGLAAVPVLAASLLLGGISAAEFARALLALAHLLALMIAVGLGASARAKDTDRAMAGTLALALSAGVLVPVALTVPLLRAINPITPLVSISDGQYARAPLAFWISIALWQTFTWFSLHTVGQRLTSIAQLQQEETFREVAPAPVKDWRKRNKSGDVVSARVRDAPRWFSENPIEWFTLRDMGMHDQRRRQRVLTITLIAAVSGMLLPPLGVFVAVVGIATLVIWLCIASARSMSRLKESGALELLLTTPLGERGILEGHRRGLRQVFGWPFAISICAVIYLILHQFDGDFGEAALFGGYAAAGICLMVWMTPWFAVMAAIKAKSPQRAIGWTIFLVLVVPRLFFCFMGDAIYFGVVGALIRRHVLRNFRQMIAERFS